MMNMQLMLGDCLELMKTIPSESVDLILCDLPYGITQNKWDTIIPLDRLWEQYKRICKGAIVLTAAQPFTSVLVCSNLKDFKHHWIWQRDRPSGHLNAKRMPMRDAEDIVTFNGSIYNPQMTQGNPSHSVGKAVGNIPKSNGNYGDFKRQDRHGTEKYPRSVLFFARPHPPIHPTQKPVALMEYMIKTYTEPGMMVLDNCMGSGTTGIACVNTGRNFVGIEQDVNYFTLAQKRILESTKLFRQEA